VASAAFITQFNPENLVPHGNWPCGEKPWSTVTMRDTLSVGGGGHAWATSGLDQIGNHIHRYRWAGVKQNEKELF
jgi:hypothetical protein